MARRSSAVPISSNSTDGFLSSTPEWARSPHFSSSPTAYDNYVDDEYGWDGDDYGYPDTDTQLPSERLLQLSPMHFIHHILVHNEEQRRRVVARVVTILERAVLSPPHRDALLELLPLIVHYAQDAPFADLRDAFSGLVAHLEPELRAELERVGRNPPSAFVSPLELVGVDTVDEGARSLLQQLFLMDGRLSHAVRTMMWHPSFVQHHTTTYSAIMKGDGPLPLPWRHYLAILAAARHGCEYLVRQQEEEFLLHGGEEAWLQGVEHVPRKVHNLLHFNALLCHQPWLLSKAHVEALVKGADSWSMAELAHAIVVMCTFHSLAGFVFGLGILPELQPAAAPLPATPTPARPENNSLFLQRLQTEEEEVSDDPTERSKEFERAEEERPGVGLEGRDVGEDWQHYLGAFPLRYVDFDVRSREYRVLSAQEFSWSEHAYSILGRLLAGPVPSLLQDEFTHLRSLTYNQFHTSSNVKTDRFRAAIWHYVHRLYGISFDDYNYSEVNRFLTVDLKMYIKKVACYPETVTYEDFLNMTYTLHPSEKCHINLITIEARKQAELTYGLYVINKMLSGTT